MNVLIITPGILPDTHTGIPKITYYLARELQRSGHKVVVLTRRYKKEHAAHEVIEGMDYYRVPAPERWGPLNKAWPLTAPIQSRRWQKKLKALHPEIDVVWVLNPWWTLLMNPKSLWPKAKIISQFLVNPYDEITANNGMTVRARTFGRLYNFVAHREMNRSDYISSLSQFSLKDALSMMGPQSTDKMIIVPGGVDMDCFHPPSGDEKQQLKNLLSLPKNCPIFITARGLKKRTGVDKLVHAAAMLKQDGIPFYLVIIGQGLMKNQIETQIKTLNLSDDVRLLSNLSEKTLADYYRASDAFVMPTQAAEAFGLATIEAISAGLVALGTNNGGTSEILERYRSDWVIPGCDETSIYQKMKDYCENPDNFSLPLETTQDVTRTHYSWPQVAKTFLEGCQLTEKIQ